MIDDYNLTFNDDLALKSPARAGDKNLKNIRVT